MNSRILNSIPAIAFITASPSVMRNANIETTRSHVWHSRPLTRGNLNATKTVSWTAFDLNALAKANAQMTQSKDSVLKNEFAALAERWYSETGMMSLSNEKAMHPAYQRIIGMGKAALPFIFEEMANKRGDWLWALCAITGEDAASPNHSFKQAFEAWIKWGKDHGYLKTASPV